jgi:hypothetical protein
VADWLSYGLPGRTAKTIETNHEARTRSWDQVDLETGTMAVWRSVRAHSDVKTQRSRRTLKLPQLAVDALLTQRTAASDHDGSRGRGPDFRGGEDGLTNGAVKLRLPIPHR